MIPQKFEPKRKNRWVLMIEGIDAYIIKTSARPTVTTEEVEVPFINSRRYLAGKTTFGTMAVTSHDPIAPSGPAGVPQGSPYRASGAAPAGDADASGSDADFRPVTPSARPGGSAPRDNSSRFDD